MKSLYKFRTEYGDFDFIYENNNNEYLVKNAFCEQFRKQYVVEPNILLIIEKTNSFDEEKKSSPSGIYKKEYKISNFLKSLEKEKIDKFFYTGPIIELKPHDRKAAKYYQKFMAKALETRREYGWNSTVKSVKEYMDCKLFITQDKSAGCALHGDEIVSVFSVNIGESSKKVNSLMALALEMGGYRLDAYTFNEVLPNLYSKFGFEEIGRSPYNTEYIDFESDKSEEEKSVSNREKSNWVKPEYTDRFKETHPKNGKKRGDVVVMTREQPKKKESSIKKFNPDAKTKSTGYDDVEDYFDSNGELKPEHDYMNLLDKAEQKTKHYRRR